MRVSYYMTRPVITVTPHTEFHQAFDMMRALRIHHLPVVDGTLVVGIVAERDLLLAAANFGSAEVPVGEIMRGPVVCVSDRVQLKQAARLLIENHIGSLPVLNANKALVGMITETDIFKTIAGMLPARFSVEIVPKKAAAKKVAKKAPASAVTAKKSPRASSGTKTAPASKHAKAGAAPKTPRRPTAR